MLRLEGRVFQNGMVIGTGIIDVWIAESRSLKDKRAVMKRILKRAQNEFNVSIAEVGENDDRRRGQIGFAMVGNDQRVINGKIDHLRSFIDQMNLCEVTNTLVEITVVSDLTDFCGPVAEKYDDL